MWGDDCALCGGPVGGNPIMVDGKDGVPLGLCSACAMRFGTEYQPSDVSPAGGGRMTVRAEGNADLGQDTSLDVGGAAGAMTRMAETREREAAELRSLAHLMERLNGELLALQDTVDERDTRIHSLEAEVNRLRERLRIAEEAFAPAFAPESSAEPAVAAATPGIAPREEDIWEAAPEESAGRETSAVDLPAPAAPQAEDRMPAPEEQAPGTEVGAAPATVSPTETSAPLVDARARWGKAGLTGDDVHLVQRYFAESIYTEKTRAVRRSLGKPIVNLHPVAGEVPRVMITIAWEIVWYQFLVDLTDSLPEDRRVQAYAEGMELSELAPQFLEDNAALDQGGRVDASELELALLANPPELITELPPERAIELEDATEEIWNKRSQPEFRWDD